MKLGEAVKRAGFRQNIALGAGLVSLRWAEGAMGVVRNLEKNLFAYLQFRVTFMLGHAWGCFFLGLGRSWGWRFARGGPRPAFLLGSRFCAVNFCRWPLSGEKRPRF